MMDEKYIKEELFMISTLDLWVWVTLILICLHLSVQSARAHTTEKSLATTLMVFMVQGLLCTVCLQQCHWTAVVLTL